jgi:hypothetical protein
MRKLSENEANVALAHSLLELVYAILKEGRAYQEPDPAQMHELEKTKLIRHHTKRLRQLGADDELIAELVAKLTAPPVCPSTEEKQTAATTPQHIFKVSAKSVPGRTWISRSQNTQARILGYQTTSGRSSFAGTAYIKTKQNLTNTADSGRVTNERNSIFEAKIVVENSPRENPSRVIAPSGFTLPMASFAQFASAPRLPIG